MHHKWQLYDAWLLRYEAWLTEFFVILDLFLPFYPIATWKIKIWKNWKRDLEISSFYTCAPWMTTIWCMVPEIWSMTDRIFCHFGPFFALLPPNNFKNRNLEKLKKRPGDIILHVYHKLQSYDVWFLSATNNFFCHFGPFFAFLHPLITWKIEILKNWKKVLKILSFYTCVL